MRAAVLTSYDAPPEAAEFDDPPSPDDGQLLVEVAAAGLNPVDLVIARGTSPYRVPALPSVCGLEGVGNVVLGDREGERIYFDNPVAPYGSMAEKALIDARSAIPVPEDLEDALAISLGIAGLAAWLALEHKAAVQPGETVLVLGASGPVGLVAVQAAKLMGAGRVIAAARNPSGLQRAVTLGADESLSLVADELDKAFLETCGPASVDVVIDPLWGPPLVAALGVIAPGARIVHLGNSAGLEATIPAARLRAKAATLHALTVFAVSGEVKAAAYAAMATHAIAGALRVDTERVALDEVAGAWARQAASPGHKLVIVPE